MKKLMSLITIWLLVTSFALCQSGTDKKAAAEKKASEERQRSVTGQRTENELKDDKGTNPPPVDKSHDGLPNSEQQQPGQQSGQVVPSNEDQSGTQNAQGAQAQTSNASSVIQTTTSESGSPSILSPNNGNGRDGTNNVQRAKPNIAGAEVPSNMNLDKKNTDARTPNPGSSRIRKEEEQPARITSPGREQGSDGKNAQVEQSNSNQPVAQPANNSQDEQVTKNKSKKRSRKNKDKDSGK